MKFFKYNIKGNIFALLVWAVLLIVIGVALLKASKVFRMHARAVNETNIDSMNSTKEKNNCSTDTEIEKPPSVESVVKEVVFHHLEANNADLTEINNATGTENNTAVTDAIFEIFKEVSGIESEVTDTYGILNNTETYEFTEEEGTTSSDVS